MDMRRITLADVDAVVKLALRGMPEDDRLRTSMQKVRDLVVFFAMHAEHFHLAAFDGAECVAAVALFVSEMPMHARCEGHVMFAYSARPGAGMPLLYAMMRWVRAQPMVQRVVWAQNSDVDSRLQRVVARRLGFNDKTVNFIYYKGGA